MTPGDEGTSNGKDNTKVLRELGFARQEEGWRYQDGTL